MIDNSFGDILRDKSLPPLQAVRNFFVGLVFNQWTAELTARLTETRLTEALPLNAEAVEVAACPIDAFEGAVLRAKVDQGRAALTRFQEFVLPRLLG